MVACGRVFHPESPHNPFSLVFVIADPVNSPVQMMDEGISELVKAFRMDLPIWNNVAVEIPRELP
jgi:hypothetical protein